MKIVCSLDFELWLQPYQVYVCDILEYLSKQGHQIYINAEKLHPAIECRLSTYPKYQSNVYVDIHLNVTSKYSIVLRNVNAEKHTYWVLTTDVYFTTINHSAFVEEFYDKIIIPFDDKKRFENQKNLKIGICDEIPRHEFKSFKTIGMFSQDVHNLKQDPLRFFGKEYSVYVFGDRAVPIQYEVKQIFSYDINFISSIVGIWFAYNNSLVDFNLIKAMLAGLCCIVKPNVYNSYLLSNLNSIQIFDPLQIKSRLESLNPDDIIQLGSQARTDILTLHPSIEKYIKELVS